MARSSYIYIARQAVFPFRIYAFTVKRELAGFLYRRTTEELNQMRVTRVHDGVWQLGKEPVEMDLAELRLQGYQQAIADWKGYRPELRGPEPERP